MWKEIKGKTGNQSRYLLKCSSFANERNVLTRVRSKALIQHFAQTEGLMYVQWKGLNQGTNTIKQGSCKITIKSNSVTVAG